MFKLVLCELWKWKRKRLLKLALLTAVFFPALNAVLLSDGDFADVMSSVREESGFLLLIPILVMLAAHLFFGEHDNDTLKNLVCIPVSKGRLVLAKMIVLLLFSVLYELLGGVVGALIASAQGLPLNGWALQFYLTFCTGILLWAAALPCVIFVVWCNRSYIISVIIAFFYTLLGYALHFSDAVMMKPLGPRVSTFLPVPVIFRWLYQFKIPEGEIMEAFYTRLRPFFIPTPAAFIILLAGAAVCMILAARVYQRQEI